MNLHQHLRGRRVLVTGHTGFKGAWLVLLLHRLGARVTGFSMPAPSDPSLFEAASVHELLDHEVEADIRDLQSLTAAMQSTRPDVVMHLAAQPLVRRSYREPVDTFATNVIGTANVLEAVRELGTPMSVIVVTSDKCYEPRHDGVPHTENDRLGGHDPYSASKAAAEIVVASYRSSYFVPSNLSAHGVQLASVRAGNVIGGGDWAEDRIVTDIVRHIMAGKSVPVRSPSAIRPWQHVLEPLSGYLTLAGAMLDKPSPGWCDGWNFGPSEASHITVRELTEIFIDAWGSGSWHDGQHPSQAKENPSLRLSVEKAKSSLPWRPKMRAENAVRLTAKWFRSYVADPTQARQDCFQDIETFYAAPVFQ